MTKKVAVITGSNLERLTKLAETVKTEVESKRKQLSKQGVHISKNSLKRGLKRIEKVNSNGKTGRNEPCPCSSGKKFKNCCIWKQ